MAKEILMDNDHYFGNPRGIMDAGDGTQDAFMKVSVSDTWYAANKDLLPQHNLLVQDGDDVKAIDCNL